MSQGDDRLVVFVTASAPMSDREEAFVQDELTTMLANGANLAVVPMRARVSRPNAAARESGLADVTDGRSLLAPAVLGGALRTIARHPYRVALVLIRILRWSGGRRNMTNNVLALPKSLWLAREVRRRNVAHIHAYWLAHTATAAYVASTISGVPWSATGYRWDIDAGNLFRAKLRSVAFLRCADEFGRDGLVAALRRQNVDPPVHLIRTGVHMSETPEWVDRPIDITKLCCIGAFVEKKAHVSVVHALAELRSRHLAAELHLCGDGPTGDAIHRACAEHGLQSVVHFHGTVPLGVVRTFLGTRPITVLPSIVTDDNQSEGIPVTLVEAMANGSPVISTATGGIPNLVTEGCGLLVAPGSVEAIVEAVETIVDHPALAAEMAHRARERVQDEFDVTRTADRLATLCLQHARPS